MSKKIEDKILEIVNIVKKCPENLQEKCFELLLSHFLVEISTNTKKAKTKEQETSQVSPIEQEENMANTNSGKQEDIIERDLHVKAKQFLKQNGLSVDNINQLFYKEDENFKPLYDDLESTQSAESQIRIALLQALVEAMENGEFNFDGENVRIEAQVRKCYDPANFTTIFKKNKDLFNKFVKYDKSNSIINLSTQGKQKLAEIIKELQ